MWRTKKEYIETKMKHYMYKGNTVLLQNATLNILKELITASFMTYL